MSFIKTMTIDGFYTPESAVQIANVVYGLGYTQKLFGKEIPDFSLIPPDADKLFSGVLNKRVRLVDEGSGNFRIPERYIHFESWNSEKDWLFVVALQQSTFDIMEHQSGSVTALDGIKHNYFNLFEWDLMVNHILKPGQGVFFRPWLFHSFDCGLIQIFRLVEE